MIKMSIRSCNIKIAEDYIVDAAISFDEIAERAAFEAVFGDFDYQLFSDGTFIVSEINFTSLCCILSSVAYCYRFDTCIIVDELDFFNTHISIKEDLLNIANLYYKIMNGSVNI